MTMTTTTVDIDESKLTKEARVMLGAFCGMMKIGNRMHFGMRGHRPSPTAQKALESCVAAGCMSFEETEEGSKIYTVLVDTTPFRRWANDHLTPSCPFKAGFPVWRPSGRLLTRFAIDQGALAPWSLRRPRSGQKNVASRVRVGIHHRPATRAFIHRLALAVVLVCHSAAGTSRARMLRRNRPKLAAGSDKLIGEEGRKLRPASLKDRAIKPGLLPDVRSWIMNGAGGAAGQEHDRQHHRHRS
jgi:hypothetical protein